MLHGQALVSLSPPQHSRVTKDAVSQVSSKSAQELPVMLALGASHAPLLSLCSAALQVLILISVHTHLIIAFSLMALKSIYVLFFKASMML